MKGGAMVRGRRTRRAVPLVAGLGVAAFLLIGSDAPSALGQSSNHLMVIMFENKEYNQVVGSPNAPYINNTLIHTGRLFTHYYSAVHPSLPNYLVTTSAGFWNCAAGATSTCKIGLDPDENIFHQMDQAALPISWKAYMEDMTSNCQVSSNATYTSRHNPPAYYQNLGVNGDHSCSSRDVPFTQVTADMTAGTLPAFAWITPNIYDDMDTAPTNGACALSTALASRVCQGDLWLSTHVPALLADNGMNDVTIVLLFDEGTTSNGGGGNTLALEVGPNTCTGCTYDGALSHYGMLLAIEDWFGLPHLTPAVASL
jgi:hypothetical protein